MDGTAKVWDCSRSAVSVEYRPPPPPRTQKQIEDGYEPPLPGINDSILVQVFTLPELNLSVHLIFVCV
jgi:hypothetical protein